MHQEIRRQHQSEGLEEQLLLHRTAEQQPAVTSGPDPQRRVTGPRFIHHNHKQLYCTDEERDSGLDKAPDVLTDRLQCREHK